MLIKVIYLAIWPFDWLHGLKGALPSELVSEKQYPKVFAWISRFRKAISAAKATAPKPQTLKGDKALQQIMSAGFAEPEGQVDESDPLKLKKGQEVEVWPTDSGFRHRDRGRLVTLNAGEVVLSAKTGTIGEEIRIHCPRVNFRIAPVDGNTSKL